MTWKRIRLPDADAEGANHERPRATSSYERGMRVLEKRTERRHAGQARYNSAVSQEHLSMKTFGPLVKKLYGRT